MLETQTRKKKKHLCTFYWWVYFSKKWKQACWSSANFQSLGVNTHSSEFAWPAFNSPRASFPHPSCPMECWHCRPSPYCIWLVCGFWEVHPRSCSCTASADHRTTSPASQEPTTALQPLKCIFFPSTVKESINLCWHKTLFCIFILLVSPSAQDTVSLCNT